MAAHLESQQQGVPRASEPNSLKQESQFIKRLCLDIQDGDLLPHACVCAHTFKSHVVVGTSGLNSQQ